MKTITTSLFILFLCFGLINAQIIHVPGDQSTIQAGIDAATEGDTVLVADSTYYENINFKGNAITVASWYIINGDTSHISKTIIDGSQSPNPDTASVVTMWSGEDTTSVLCGFTITGGKGTILVGPGFWGKDNYSGGGVVIFGSGGKIIHNIIEENHLSGPTVEGTGVLGCGILATVYNNRTVIIRDNIIRNNSGSNSFNGLGGGISLWGGKVVVENNSIINNTIEGEYPNGGGLYCDRYGAEGIIEELIIRNNLISGNVSGGWGGGIATGGVQLGGIYENSYVYNNLIMENQAKFGGAIYGWESPLKVFNNTFANNEAVEAGNIVELADPCHMIMYNNIFWLDTDNGIENFHIGNPSTSSLQLFYNMLSEEDTAINGITHEGNYFFEPIFTEGSYELEENSPGIGWGVDSVLIGDTWYYAPSHDFNGNPRPFSIDNFVDLAAFESTFKRTIPVYIDHTVLSTDDPISIYPNPFSTSTTLQMEDNMPVVRIEVVNMMGSVVQIIGNISENTITIHRNNLPPGLYFIRIHSDETYIKKVMIR